MLSPTYVNSLHCSCFLCGFLIKTVATSLTRQSQNHSFVGALSSEDIFHAFTMNALLHEAAEDEVCLILPGTGDNDESLKHAIELRNHKMIILSKALQPS